MIHFIASTGCRIGAIPEIKLKHVSNIENYKAIHFYADTNEEYFGFLTPEASKFLDDYLKERENDHEVLGNESPLFRKAYSMGGQKDIANTMISLKIAVATLVKEDNLNRIKQGRT